MSEVSFFASVGTEALRYVTLSFHIHHIYQSMPTHIILCNLSITIPLYTYIYTSMAILDHYTNIYNTWFPLFLMACASIPLLYFILPKASLPRTSPVMTEFHAMLSFFRMGVHGCLVFVGHMNRFCSKSRAICVSDRIKSGPHHSLYRIQPHLTVDRI
jgi:hypothetical protein